MRCAIRSGLQLLTPAAAINSHTLHAAQLVKRIARNSNFNSLVCTVATHMDMVTALDFKGGTHLNFNHIHLGQGEHNELCSFGSNSIVDTLFKDGTLPPISVVQVTWSSVLYLSASTTLASDAWVLLEIDGSTFLARIHKFFQVQPAGVIFFHHQPYPLNLLTVDPLYSSYTMPLATLEAPDVPTMTHSFESVTKLTRLGMFIQDADPVAPKSGESPPPESPKSPESGESPESNDKQEDVTPTQNAHFVRFG